jgi:hypothetical protein
MIGIWAAASTAGAGAMQHQRREGTLELLAAAPAPFFATLAPVTLAMSTVGLCSMAATVIWAHLNPDQPRAGRRSGLQNIGSGIDGHSTNATTKIMRRDSEIRT